MASHWLTPAHLSNARYAENHSFLLLCEVLVTLLP